MFNAIEQKCLLVACFVCIFVISYALLNKDSTLTLEVRFNQKEAHSTDSQGCVLGTASNKINWYNFVAMCPEHKIELFKYLLSNSYESFKYTPEQQHMDLILLGQLNRDISESSLGQLNREINEKQQNDVVIVGTLHTSRPYSVFSTTLSTREALSSIFLLPLTVLSWKKVGFESIISVVGWRDEWNTDPLYSEIFLICRKLGAVLIFLQPKPENNVKISQVAPLFAANILIKEFYNQPGIRDVYILTTSIDIWPVNDTAYNLPEQYDILSLNSFCCSPHTSRSLQYRIPPMSQTHVGARISTWGALTELNGIIPTTVDDMLSMIQLTFEKRGQTIKESAINWYHGQYIANIRIDKFLKANAINKNKRVKFIARNTGSSELVRNNVPLFKGIDGLVQNRQPLNSFTPSFWLRATDLLRILYGHNSPEYEFCFKYYTQYQERLSMKYNELENNMKETIKKSNDGVKN